MKNQAENLLLSEFIGSDENLNFNNDFNLIMQVIDKIEKMGVSVKHTSNYHPIHKENFNQVSLDFKNPIALKNNAFTYGDSFYKYSSKNNDDKIGSYFEVCVNFVKWNNSKL